MKKKKSVAISNKVEQSKKFENPDNCKGHIPNDETARVLKELDSGKGCNKSKSLDDFWRSFM